MRFFHLLLAGCALFYCERGAVAGDYDVPFKKPDILSATYVEEKYIPSLKNPIRSSGRFVYVDGGYVGWFVTSPYDIKTIIYDDSLVQIVNGEEQSQSQAMQDAMHLILEHVTALFSGDREQISNIFFIEDNGMVGDEHHIILTPRSENMAEYVQSIELNGTDYINRVMIDFGKGQYTIMRYSSHAVGMDAISQEERNYLRE